MKSGFQFTEKPPEEGTDPEYRDHERLSRYFSECVMQEVSGCGDGIRGERALADLPSDLYFAGSIVPSKQAGMSNLSEDLQSKLSPSAIQAAFLLNSEEVVSCELTVTVSGHVYVRTFPAAEEQFDSSYVSMGELDEEEPEPDQSGSTEFVKSYRRIEFESEPIEIEIPQPGQIKARGIVEGEIESRVLQTVTEELKRRVRTMDEESVNPSECDPGSQTPPVWRAAVDVPKVKSIDISDVPGVPEGATIEVDEYSGEYQLPEGVFNQSNHGHGERALDKLVDKLVDRGHRPTIPPWDLDVQCEFSEDGAGIRGELVVENTSEPRPDTKGYESDYGADVYDTTVFDLTATLEIEGGVFEDFTFERLEQDFRYDRELPGHGTGCTVTRINDQTLETTYLPTYRQGKYETRDPTSFDPPLDTSFQTLSNLEDGGLKTLENVAEQMWEYHDEYYKEALERYRRQDDFRTEDEEEFEKDRVAFKKEILRLERGIECLRWDIEEGDGHVSRAFELMNKAFVRKVTDEDGEMEYNSWRLFQIVFILRVLPDLVSREYDKWAEVTWRDGEAAENFSGDEMEALDLVDILWFPTGGGKTEAYLGLSIFGAFFDRKRGKSYGVTAWTRFPLRLLSLQQTQRIGELLMHAEMLRVEEDDISGEGNFPFSLGYLVGSKNTPNKVSKYASPYRNEDSDAYLREFNKFATGEGSKEQRDEIKIFPSCPVCGADVDIRPTEDLRLAHYCTAEETECPYQSRPRAVTDDEYRIFADDELPVHIVDNELYRYAPTMIVGTIDKITAVGYERKSAHVYSGKMTHWCPDHGFASFGECTEKYGCHGNYGGDNPDGSHLRPLSETPFGEPYDPAPGLQIQDELHLLEETLGTFDSHFETFTDLCQRYNNEQRTKIIGATATIEEYDDQVRQLYMRKAERFPAEGPELRENFYAITKRPTRRRFAGIMPHGKTHINAIIQINYYYLRTIGRLKQRATELSDPVPEIDLLGLETVESNEDLLNFVEYYETCLTYTISKRDKNRYNQSMLGQIAGYLREDGLQEPKLEELTGDTPFDRVEDILDNLEEPPEEHEERYNVISATNMISHGVDIERFNFMVFFGMPRQTAEYIQSSSRAGRSYPGNILLCFNPARERDQSHYHLFEKYHEFLDRLVEPVPVNRWSHHSVERTLPSMVFGWILNQWLYETGERLFFGDDLSDLILNLEAGKGSESGVSIEDTGDFQELLRRSYGEDLCGSLPEAFEKRLDRRADRIFSQLENIQADFASEALNPGPMISLRDIDEPIAFKPHDDDNRRLFNTLTHR